MDLPKNTHKNFICNTEKEPFDTRIHTWIEPYGLEIFYDQWKIVSLPLYHFLLSLNTKKKKIAPRIENCNCDLHFLLV